MFTGIVSDVGRVRAVRKTDRDLRIEIETAYDPAAIDIGASINHAGCCLTVVEKGEDWFAVEVSGETVAMSTLGDWAPGRPVNLERAARAGDPHGDLERDLEELRLTMVRDARGSDLRRTDLQADHG